VIGAGIGGLTPARGLRRAGIEVAVRPPGDLDGRGLVEPALGRFDGWSTPFRELVASTDPNVVGSAALGTRSRLRDRALAGG
jgi:flavin-dependent dehydrogenase